MEPRGIGAGWWVGLALIAVVFLGLGAAYVGAKPLGQAPDEHDHVAYVAWLLDTGTLPRMWTPRTGGIGQGDEPPLYYATLAAAVRVSGIDLATPGATDRGYRLIRLITLVLCGLPVVLLTAVLARRLTPNDGATVFLATALTAFLPMFVHLTTSVGNGRMADAMSAALVVLAVVAVTRRAPWSIGCQVLHGTVIGLAVLSKLSVAPVVAAAGALFLWLAWRSPRRWLAIAALALPVLVVVGPWIVYNLHTYGEPVAFTANMETFFRTNADTPRGLGLVHLPGIWRYYLGVFGFGTPDTGIVLYPDWVYGAAFAVTAIALAAGPLVGRLRRREASTAIAPIPPAARWFFTAAVVLTALFFCYTNWRIQHLQSRYLFVVLPVLSCVLGRAALAPFTGRTRAGVAVLGGVMALTLSVWGFYLVRSGPS